jgi:hypothetical protein
MTAPGRSGGVGKWLAAVAAAVVLALAAARCARDVSLGVDPNSDAAARDGPADGGAAD